MIYTIDNPKLVNNCYFPEENNFTGVIKSIHGTIAYYKNGKPHRIDGPAIMWSMGAKDWYIHGKRHRIDGPAVEHINGDKEWWYNGERYFDDNGFTVESWIKKWRLEIFK